MGYVSDARLQKTFQYLLNIQQTDGGWRCNKFSFGRGPETGSYAHGVEVPADYSGTVPEGFDTIDLAPCKLIVFQGEPYKDEDFQEAVGICMDRISTFNPEVYGYWYASELAPRMQLSPQGWRGYIEMLPVKRME